MKVEPGSPILLTGDAYMRGRMQAFCGEPLRGAVQGAIDTRLIRAGALLEKPSIRSFLDEQARLLEVLDPESTAEVRGIADGFDRSFDTVFTYLHLGILADFATDGCSAWSWGASPTSRPVLVKNRDYRGEHALLQRVFLHRDPERPGRAILCVGSLGSPGAFSSGMNAHGFALVDTHVSTSDHGPGLLRYFLMTRLLWNCGSVEEALELIAETPHAGGGTIVMADASGDCAAVELGHKALSIETGPYVVRTNHFVSSACASSWLPAASDPMAASTKGRYARIEAWLGDQDDCPPLSEIVALMGGHTTSSEEALCRHGQDDHARTISSSIFAPAELRLYFSSREPCAGQWSSFDCRP
ncbi:C45 family autoproteolytic acyltransferase/hydolase [Microvirga lotononidis]|uniref:Putative choloylglycine hydrolase n=1 Tax=Microvirga lotononidis TaxID=864069 RepID=I4YXW9_9HYPH|nr:C45 family peptidase [Microvirga lotononidis]EIM28811.1 putative choloylglycine hydrolase [Microvirga lotononidis]WQO25459.1 C45 family peptidase [Microvirga lotononidis]